MNVFFLAVFLQKRRKEIRIIKKMEIHNHYWGIKMLLLLTLCSNRQWKQPLSTPLPAASSSTPPFSAGAFLHFHHHHRHHQTSSPLSKLYSPYLNSTSSRIVVDICNIVSSLVVFETRGIFFFILFIIFTQHSYRLLSFLRNEMYSVFFLPISV